MNATINLDGIRQDIQLAQTSRKTSWGRETEVSFDLLTTSLRDYLRLPEGSRVCKAYWESDITVAVCHLSNEDLGHLGIIRFTRWPNYTEIEYNKEAGRAGELFAKLLDGWLQALGTAKQRIEAHSGAAIKGEAARHIGDRAGGPMTWQYARPGRKPDPNYDEAFSKVCSGELSQGEAYKWFLKQPGITPDKGTRDAFNAAMRRRRDKTATK